MSLIERTRKVHFIGIGGIGMSGLAELLLKLGHQVTGSDQSDSDVVARLRQLGAHVQVGHDDRVLREHPADVVVFSTAVRSDNPEMVYARTHRVPIIRRAEMLSELMRLKRGIALAGSHGKTTTTGLTSLLLRTEGLDPTVVIGGRFDAIGSNAALGGGRWLVAEADESDGSFLRLTPELAVVTNIDREHLDHYGDFTQALRAFEEFLDRVPFYGRAILCSDCPNLRSIGERLMKPRYWYGFEAAQKPDFLVKILREGAQPEFEIRDMRCGDELWLQVKLAVPGRHNMLNATAAALVAAELEISREVIGKALANFRGVRRRFEWKGTMSGHAVIEDYAHHPTEIRATLAAALSAYQGVKPVVVFQPHRYTRTRDLWNDFATCFEVADRVYSLPIYAASEPHADWTIQFDGARFAENIRGAEASFCVTKEELADRLRAECRQWPMGAPLLVLGAGDVAKIIPKILDS